MPRCGRPGAIVRALKITQSSIVLWLVIGSSPSMVSPNVDIRHMASSQNLIPLALFADTSYPTRACPFQPRQTMPICEQQSRTRNFALNSFPAESSRAATAREPAEVFLPYARFTQREEMSSPLAWSTAASVRMVRAEAQQPGCFRRRNLFARLWWRVQVSGTALHAPSARSEITLRTLYLSPHATAAREWREPRSRRNYGGLWPR